MEKPVMSCLNDHMTPVYAVCPGGLLLLQHSHPGVSRGKILGRLRVPGSSGLLVIKVKLTGALGWLSWWNMRLLISGS